MAKIDKRIECSHCNKKGYVRIRRHDSVTKKGKSWVRMKCKKCFKAIEKR